MREGKIKRRIKSAYEKKEKEKEIEKEDEKEKDKEKEGRRRGVQVSEWLEFSRRFQKGGEYMRHWRAALM